MKVLLAPDKFNGSLSGKEVCQAISIGLKKQGKEMEIKLQSPSEFVFYRLEILFLKMSLLF